MDRAEFLQRIDEMFARFGRPGDGVYIMVSSDVHARLRHAARKGKHFKLGTQPRTTNHFPGPEHFDQEYNSARPHPRWDKRSQGDSAYNRSK